MSAPEPPGEDATPRTRVAYTMRDTAAAASGPAKDIGEVSARLMREVSARSLGAGGLNGTGGEDDDEFGGGAGGLIPGSAAPAHDAPMKWLCTRLAARTAEAEAKAKGVAGLKADLAMQRSDQEDLCVALPLPPPPLPQLLLLLLLDHCNTRPTHTPPPPPPRYYFLQKKLDDNYEIISELEKDILKVEVDAQRDEAEYLTHKKELLEVMGSEKASLESRIRDEEAKLKTLRQSCGEQKLELEHRTAELNSALKSETRSHQVRAAACCTSPARVARVSRRDSRPPPPLQRRSCSRSSGARSPRRNR